jgi:RNA polymerase sigma factor (sigma-70 family)
MRGDEVRKRLEKYSPLAPALVEHYMMTKDAADIAELQHMYNSILFYYALFRVDEVDAKDAVQQTWEELIVTLQKGKYKEQHKFWEFLKTILISQLVAIERGRYKTPQAEEQPAEEATHELDPEQALEEKEARVRFRRALMHQTRRERKIIMLHDIHHKSFEEVRILLNIPSVNIVRAMHSRAVKQIIREVRSRRK